MVAGDCSVDIPVDVCGCGISDSASAQMLLQLWNELEQITYQADIGDLENRGFTVLVDCHDGSGVLDPGQVLKCTGYTYGPVPLRSYELARLAYLQFVRHISGIDGRTGGAHGGTHLVGKPIDDFEIFPGAYAAAA